MDKPFLGGILVALALVVAGGALVMAPRMQSPQAKVAALVGEDTERARRTLNRFSENEERIGVLLDALAHAGIDPNLKPEDVQRLLEEEDGRTAVEEQDVKLKEVLRAGQGTAGELEERFLKAAHGSDWQQHQEPSRPGLGANVSQMGSALQQGLRERDRLIDENKALLGQALKAVEAALSESVGDARGDAEMDPNRLHGVALYHLGEAKRREADVLRRRAATHLNRLASAGVEANGLEHEKNLLAAVGIEARIAQAQRKRTKAQAALSELNTAQAELQSKIDGLKGRIAELKAASDSARVELEKMEEQGARLDYAGGFEQFARQFNDTSKRYREALSEVHRLESGTLRNARIDTSGDFIKGQYLPRDAGSPIEPDPGLPGLEGQLAALQLQVAAAEGEVAAGQAEVERLEALRSEYRDRATAAEARLTKVAEAAGVQYDEFERIAAEAESAQEESSNYYTKSIAAFSKAASAAAERSSAAEGAMTGLSDEARQRRPGQQVADNAWFEQQFRINAADAQIRLGSLNYRIWSEDERIAKVLADLPASLALKEVSADAWREKSAAAKAEGVEILHKAYDAIQRTGGPLKGHWTLAAEAAAAASLLNLFGESAMKDIAIAAYEGVVADQSDKPFVEAYVERLKVLKKP